MPKPKKTRRGRPVGAKSTTTTPFTAKVYASVTPEQKRLLERHALDRRHAEGLTARWGVSDLVRELIEEYLDKPE